MVTTKIHQAMSTPITDVPGSVPPMLINQDSVPLPTPRIPTTRQEERGTLTSSSTLSNPPTTSPLFNINRANVQAASSVSSLEEGEGIVNDDEYERAIRRIEKINKKITTLVRNWNEESKSTKTPTKVIEFDEFYRPYMDQCNTRQKALERLIEIYVEYYKDVTPTKASQHKHATERDMPQPAPRTGQTTIKETVERTATNKKEQPHGEGMSEETRLKQGMDGNTSISTFSGAQPMTTMSTINPTITNSLTSTGSFSRPTTEIVEIMRAHFKEDYPP